MKLEWKEKMSDITNLNRRKLHKTSKSEQRGASSKVLGEEKEVEDAPPSTTVKLTLELFLLSLTKC